MSRNHAVGHHKPIEETLAALGLASADIAHDSADNPAIVPVAAGPVPTILASVILTPKVTGKFAVSGSVVASNDAESGEKITLGVAHGALPGANDYTADAGVLVPGGSTKPAAIDVQYGSTLIAMTFPLGVPVQIDLTGNASAGDISIPAHGAQISVVELSD